jgi:hypothetical protein
MVGGRARTDKGNLIFMPYPKYSYDGFTGENEQGKPIWTEESLKWGNKLVSHLLAIDKAISLSADKTPPPDWVSENKFTLKKERTLAGKISSLEKKNNKPK